MAKTYRHTFGKRIGNNVLTRLVRAGKGPKLMRVVTVRGRRSGKTYDTPVYIMSRPEGRYWVSTFGETQTIKNARAASRVTLTRGDEREEVSLTEVPVGERVALLRAYLNLNRSPMVRRYFGATRSSSDEELDAIAPDHAVFKLDSA